MVLKSEWIESVFTLRSKVTYGKENIIFKFREFLGLESNKIHFSEVTKVILQCLRGKSSATLFRMFRNGFSFSQELYGDLTR